MADKSTGLGAIRLIKNWMARTIHLDPLSEQREFVVQKL
jgi:hypothetical protein